jgi:glycosyltransferase involved in cell wall biosynthesis
MMDVFVRTYNSERYLNQCFLGIEETFGNRISIVDHHSSDGTLEIAARHGVRVYFDTEGLAEAIQICCEKAETEFFAIIDSDVELKAGSWLSKLNCLMREQNIGGVGLRMYSEEPLWRQKYCKFWLGVNDFTEIMSGDWVNAYVVRKDAVKNIKVPIELEAFEHVFLKDYILRGGYCLAAVETNCVHHYDFPANKGSWLGAGARIYNGLRGFSYIILNKFFLSPFKAVPPALVYRDPTIIFENANYWFKFLRGYLQPERYIGLSRKALPCQK